MKAHLVILDMEKPSKMIVLIFLFFYFFFTTPWFRFLLIHL